MSEIKASDLDSLDALLDVAELEAQEQTANEEALPAEQEALATDSLPDPEPESITTPESAAAAPEPVTASGSTPESPPARVAAPEPLVKRKAVQSHQNAWTEAEMDSVKKLIIIFSSVIIVLILAVMGVGITSLVKQGKVDPTLVEAVEGTKSDVERAALLSEDAHKQIKILGQQISEVSSQLAEVSALMTEIKNTPPVAAVEPTSKTMSAAERKAALREKIAHAQQAETEPPQPETEQQHKQVGEEATMSSETLAKVDGMSADIKDIRKRLITAQKMLELIQKQSELLQQQSMQLIDSVKVVEKEVKARQVVKVVAPERKPQAKADVKGARDAEPKPLVPADDPQWRSRWIQQMDKSEGFP